MKKFLSVVLAVVLCLGMTTTVFAANSPEGNKSPAVNNNKVTTATATIDGKEVNVAIKNVADANLTAAQQEVMDDVLAVVNGSDLAAKDKLEKKLIKDVAGKEVATIAYSNLVDIELGTAIPEGGVEITIYDSSIKSGMSITLLHLKDDGTWESLNAKAYNGFLVARFTSLSPVYYFQTVSSSRGPIVEQVASPKTVDTNMSLYVTMLAVAALGCAVFCSRKYSR